MGISRRSVLVFAALGAVPFASAQAQDYPNRTIRLILPFAAGGGADTYGRPLAQQVSKSVGQPVVIENITGAGGIIGTQIAARSPADGYTFLMISGSNAVNETLYPNRGFDLQKDFDPVTLVAVQPFVLVVNKDVPIRTLPELIALAKAKPGQLAFATPGAGTIHHMSMEYLRSRAGIDLLHVPYKQSGAGRTDLLSGQVQIMMDGLATMQTHIKSGAVRAIAITSPKRISSAPELPTIAETVPGYEADSFAAFLAPRGTPPDAIGRFQKEVAAALQRPETQEAYRAIDTTAVGSTPEEMGAFLAREIAKWRDVVNQSGVRLVQ